MKTLFKGMFVAAFVAALVLSGAFRGLWMGAGVFLITFGFAASLLMGFSGREITGAIRAAGNRSESGAALARAGYFWEAAARNAWILGVLGSVITFIIAMSKESAGIADVTARVAQAFVVTLYGLILAAICLIPALIITGRRRTATLPATSGSRNGSPAGMGGLPIPGRILGYIIFAVVIAAAGYSISGGVSPNSPLPVRSFILPWPSTLVVLGGTAALALFAWTATGPRSLTLGLAMTGLISLLAGFIQAVFGFVHHNIQEIASAIIFIISSSLLVLLGMLAVAAPLEDREVMEGRRKRADPMSRMFWISFPLMTFVLLLLAFLAIVTPMTKSGPG